MTAKMRRQILVNGIERHSGVTEHTADCCAWVEWAQSQIAEIDAQNSVFAAPAPTATAPAAVPAAPVRTYHPRPGRPATPGQMEYLRGLLKSRDVSHFWRTEAERLLISPNPGFDETSRALDQMKGMTVLPSDVRPVTPKMDHLLRRLLRTRVWDQEVDVDTLSFEVGHALIDSLLAAPVKPRATGFPPEGMYFFEGQYYRIQLAVHGTGRPMCKVLDPETGHFERTKGMSGKLTTEHRVSREQAKQFGALYGRCMCCGAVLTDSRSIEDGTGPICGKRYF